MKVLVSLSLVFVCFVACERPRWHQLDNTYTFEKYKMDFAKSYETNEENEKRREIFTNTLQAILTHNEKKSSYKLGVNHMTDWTEAERKKLLGYDQGLGHRQVRERNAAFESGKKERPSFGGERTLPLSVDWRDQGILTAVKDQGQCGSCWTFASSESVETYWAMATGELYDLSEEQIVSCVANPLDCGGDGGCGGGTAELAFSSLVTTGLASEWKYPYLSWHGRHQECRYDPAVVGPPVARLSGFQLLPSNDYSLVLRALAFVGPLAINVDAATWHTYETGVFDGCDMVNPDIDHVVQLVGYGNDPDDGNYWIIRNSWTPAWGELGFIRVRRDYPFACGIDETPNDGVTCDGGPMNVTVCGMCGVLYDVSFPKVSV